MKLQIEKFEKARAELSRHMRASPLIYNPWLSEEYGCEIYLKLENMLPTGSFKLRGATYRISKLSDGEKKKGVIAASAGNHAQGVAWGAQRYGVNALIVMPQNASLAKVEYTTRLGADVVLEGQTFDECYSHALSLQKKSGRVFIHPFEDPEIIYGQGTVGLEILEQLPEVDAVFGSIGGGGLMAGVSSVFQELKPKTMIVGVQASGAASMVNSFRKGSAITLDKVETLADGVAVARASQEMLDILKAGLDEVIGCDEDAIVWAIYGLLKNAKIVAEGSGALPLAALEKFRSKIKDKKIVLIVSGGNIDPNLLERVLSKGLVMAGRRLKLGVVVRDQPGSLARITGRVAKSGGNILEIAHVRDNPGMRVDQTKIIVTLEVRNTEHGEKILEDLATEVHSVEKI